MPKKQQVTIDGHELIITNSEKVYFPANGFTKGEVVKFYADIAVTILRHLRDRPLTLKRSPDGITGEPFYEKNAGHAPPWVKTFGVPRSEGGGDINYTFVAMRDDKNPGAVSSRDIAVEGATQGHPTNPERAARGEPWSNCGRQSD